MSSSPASLRSARAAARPAGPAPTTATRGEAWRPQLPQRKLRRSRQAERPAAASSEEAARLRPCPGARSGRGARGARCGGAATEEAMEEAKPTFSRAPSTDPSSLGTWTTDAMAKAKHHEIKATNKPDKKIFLSQGKHNPVSFSLLSLREC